MVPVISLIRLKQNKAASGRAKDLADLGNPAQVLSVLERSVPRQRRYLIENKVKNKNRRCCSIAVRGPVC